MTTSNWIFLGLGTVFVVLVVRKERNNEQKKIDRNTCQCSDSVRSGMVDSASSDTTATR